MRLKPPGASTESHCGARESFHPLECETKLVSHQENTKCCCLGLGLGCHPSLNPHTPMPLSVSHDDKPFCFSTMPNRVSCSTSRVLGHHNHHNSITKPALSQFVRKHFSYPGTPNSLLSRRTPAPLNTAEKLHWLLCHPTSRYAVCLSLITRCSPPRDITHYDPLRLRHQLRDNLY